MNTVFGAILNSIIGALDATHGADVAQTAANAVADVLQGDIPAAEQHIADAAKEVIEGHPALQ